LQDLDDLTRRQLPAGSLEHLIGDSRCLDHCSHEGQQRLFCRVVGRSEVAAPDSLAEGRRYPRRGRDRYVLRVLVLAVDEPATAKMTSSRWRTLSSSAVNWA
jgi:hypothetical protein